MFVKIEIDNETGEQVFKLPSEIIEKFDLFPGDLVHFEELENGCIQMTFPK